MQYTAFTDELPSKVGWYFYKRFEKDNPIAIRVIWKGDDRFCIWFPGSFREMEMEEFIEVGGLWLPMPINELDKYVIKNY